MTPPNQYTTYRFELTGLLTPGNSFILRFAEVDNQFFLHQGIDNVKFSLGFEQCDDGNVLDGDCCSSTCERFGDINNSSRTDGSDLSRMGKALGTSLGDSGFDPGADIVQDDIINGVDVDLLTAFFGCGE